jgi:hypothetical protein
MKYRQLKPLISFLENWNKPQACPPFDFSCMTQRPGIQRFQPKLRNNSGNNLLSFTIISGNETCYPLTQGQRIVYYI